MTAQDEDSPDALPSFDRRGLSRFDGSRDRLLVACQGWVYDVSDSPEWRAGLHRGLHWAGQDLSDALAEAPHGIETLQRFPVVGKYLG